MKTQIVFVALLLGWLAFAHGGEPPTSETTWSVYMANVHQGNIERWVSTTNDPANRFATRQECEKSLDEHLDSMARRGVLERIGTRETRWVASQFGVEIPEGAVRLTQRWECGLAARPVQQQPVESRPRPSKFPEAFGDLFARVSVKQTSPGVWEYTIHNWDRCPINYLTLFAVAEGVKGKGPADWLSPGAQIGQFITNPVADEHNQIEFFDLYGTGVLSGQSLGGFTLSGSAKPMKMRYLIISLCPEDLKHSHEEEPSSIQSEGVKRTFMDSILGPGIIPPEETPNSGPVRP